MCANMDMTFTRRWDSFVKSLDALSHARERDKTDEFVLSGTSAKFCMTFDLAWKLLKDVLVQRYGIVDFVAGSPRETLKEAFSAGLIDDQDVWLGMLKLRNTLSHDYDGAIIAAEFDAIVGAYVDALLALKEHLVDLDEG